MLVKTINANFLLNIENSKLQIGKKNPKSSL